MFEAVNFCVYFGTGFCAGESYSCFQAHFFLNPIVKYTSPIYSSSI